MRDYKKELENRTEFIRKIVSDSNSKGIVYGNSGGKDSALVGILCKKACENTIGLLMPCQSRRNFEIDMVDGLEVAKQFSIETRTFDLTDLKTLAMETIGRYITLSDIAKANIAPRLRMITLYAVAASEKRLVAGTGNASEAYMGYFTKWGDGAHDFNPIADLTVTEIYEFLEFLDAPRGIIEKAPSAGLFEGQTDEGEMGITYKKIDDYLLKGEVTAADKALIEQYHAVSEHKRHMPVTYGDK